MTSTGLVAIATVFGLSLMAAQKPADPAAERKKAEKNELPLDPAGKLEFETNEGT